MRKFKRIDDFNYTIKQLRRRERTRDLRRREDKEKL